MGDDGRRNYVRNRLHDLLRFGARYRHGRLRRHGAVGTLRRSNPVPVLTRNGHTAGDRWSDDGEGTADAVQAREDGPVDGSRQRVADALVRDTSDQRELHGVRRVHLWTHRNGGTVLV